MIQQRPQFEHPIIILFTFHCHSGVSKCFTGMIDEIMSLSLLQQSLMLAKVFQEMLSNPQCTNMQFIMLLLSFLKLVISKNSMNIFTSQLQHYEVGQMTRREKQTKIEVVLYHFLTNSIHHHLQTRFYFILYLLLVTPQNQLNY